VLNESTPRARAIFFGTPEFAVPCLSALAEIAQVVCVVTQPDRPSGRGMKLAAPPVKLRAQELGLAVIQPTKVRTPEFAYGRILPAAVLSAPRLGCVNVHASLLPKLRGAAPIQWSIVHGESQTGVCLMQMDEGMDTGPLLARASLSIGPEETSSELTLRLSALGAELLRRELPRLLRGELCAEPQDAAQATLAPVLRKDHGQVDWQGSATQIHDLVRGMSAWPGAYTWLDGTRVKLHAVQVKNATERLAEPGVILRASSDGLEVACGHGSVLVTEVQLEGSRRMPAGAFVAGHRLPSQARFGMSHPA
jgi:methionyl-tRNA formyltransferase